MKSSFIINKILLLFYLCSFPPLVSAYDLTEGAPLPQDSLAKRIDFLRQKATPDPKQRPDTYEFSMDGQVFSLKIHEQGDKLWFRILGKVHGSGDQSGDQEEIESECLSYNVNKTTGLGNVFFIGTNEVDCHLPEHGKGNFILKVVDQLTTTLAVTQNTLSDASTVRCEKNGEESSLSLLHLMQKGKTWYGSKGYRPESVPLEEFNKVTEALRGQSIFSIFSDVRKNVEKETQLLPQRIEEVEKMKEAICTEAQINKEQFPTMSGFQFLNKLRNGNLPDGRRQEVQNQYNQWRTKVDILSYIKNLPKQISQMEELLDRFAKTDPSMTVEQFFSKVWKDSCEDFNWVQDFFFPRPYWNITHGSWTELYNYYFRSSHKMIKTYGPYLPPVVLEEEETDSSCSLPDLLESVLPQGDIPLSTDLIKRLAEEV